MERVPTEGRGDYAGPLFSRQQMRYWLKQQEKVDEHQRFLQRRAPIEAKLTRKLQVQHLAKHNARGVCVRPLVAALAAAGAIAPVQYPIGCDVDYVAGVDRIVAWLV